MIYFYYKNSVLASIISILGCAAIAVGVYSIYDGEIEALSGIGVIAAGVLLAAFGKWISVRKEKKKALKAQRAAEKAAQTSAQERMKKQSQKAFFEEEKKAYQQPARENTVSGMSGKQADLRKITASAEEQLKAYKDFLDCGIITRAEYERKKRELTGE